MKKKYSIVFSIMLLFVFLAGCTKTTYEGSANIIEPKELGNQLGKAGVVVIDARAKEDYDKGHLTGAVSLMPSELSTVEPVPGMLLPKEDIEKILSSKGISNDSVLYIYDNNGGVNAARVWWTLKVYGHENVKVVNHGENGIVLAGLKLSMDVPELPAAQYSAKEANTEMIVALDEMKSISADENSTVRIIDVRSNAEYDEGAIPHALLYPHTKNLYTDGSFKSARNIYLSYKGFGLNKEDEIVLYCKTSFRAAQTALLLEEAGFTNVRIYDGAWAEWSMGNMPSKAKEEKAVTSGDAS